MLCPPSLTQYAVARYLDTQPWHEQIKLFTELYRERRDATLESLDALMPPGATWTRPEGGFYVWLKLPHGLDAKLMQPRAVTAHVAYVPGDRLLRRRRRPGVHAAVLLLPRARPDPRGRAPAGPVIEAELDLHSTFDGVDTGTFRAIGRGTARARRRAVRRPRQQRALRGPPVSEPPGAPAGRRPPSRPLRAVVLAGGLAFEREVSLSSGTQVVEELERAGLDAELRDADAEPAAGLAAAPADAVFIALHGATGEDGALRAVLDLAGVPYVGSLPPPAGWPGQAGRQVRRPLRRPGDAGLGGAAAQHVP